MAVRTSVGSGDWSAAGTWDTGVPVDGDSAVIASGHTVDFDVDQSGFATGMVGVTCTGTLRAKTGGARVLKMSGVTAQNIAVGAAGRLEAGSSGTPFPIADSFTINLNGASNITITAGGIVELYCTQPTTLYTNLYQAEAAGQTVLETDADLTLDAVKWTDYPGTIQVNIDNINKAKDSEKRTLSSLTTGALGTRAITVSAGLTGSKLAGSYVILLTRNVRIIGFTTTAVTGGNSGVFQCEFDCSSCTTASSVLISTASTSALGHRFSGVAHSVGTDGRFFGCSGGAMSGIITGMNTGNSSGIGSVFSGLISGCTSASSNGTKYGNLYTTAFIATGCTNGINLDHRSRVFGTVKNCGTGIVTSSIGLELRGATLSNNNTDIQTTAGATNQVVGYGASLNSATQVDTTYLQQVQGGWQSIVMWDIGGVAGALKAWMPGGVFISDTATNTLTNAPSSLIQFKGTPGSAGLLPCFLDIPFYGRNGVTLNVTVYCKKDTNSMAETPVAQIIDPNVQTFLGGADVLASATMADDTNLQKLTMSYTPAADGPLTFRFRGKHTSGNYWFAVQGLGGEGGLLRHPGMAGGLVG